MPKGTAEENDSACMKRIFACTPRVLTGSLFALLACSDSGASTLAPDAGGSLPDAAASGPDATTVAQAPHWEYMGEDGPDHWGELDRVYDACATGSAQSPIDLKNAMAKDLAALAPTYQAAAISAVNNGHTIQVNVPAGSSLIVEGVPYALAQFHFHHPSEHTLNGVSFPLEVHLVHKSASGSLAVVGVFFKVGAANTALAPLFADLPEENKTVTSAATIDPAQLLPSERLYFKYPGSLTTPPCSEGVKWHVFQTPIEISQAQLDAFASRFAMNARPIQPLGSRELDVDSAP